MSLYCGIDLHSNNNIICVTDEKDNRIFKIKLDNDVAENLAIPERLKRHVLAHR